MKAEHASLQLQSNWERDKSQKLCAIVYDEKITWKKLVPDPGAQCKPPGHKVWFNGHEV